MDRDVTTASYWTCHNTVNEWRPSTDVKTSPWYTAQYPVGATAVCWGSSFGSKQWRSHQCFPSLTNTRRKVSIHQSQKAKVVSTASALKEVDTTALWRREASGGNEAIHIKRYKNDMMKQKMFIDVFSFWVVNKRDGTVSLRNCSFTGLRSPLLNSLSWRETNTFQSMGDLWIWSENPLYRCFIQWIQFYDQMELVWKFDCCNTEKCAPGVNVFIKYWGNLTYLFRYVRYESIFGSNKHCITNGA